MTSFVDKLDKAAMVWDGKSSATDKLEGIKPGDRVRVTFEANVIRLDDDGAWLNRDGLIRECEDWWGPLATTAPTFQIERIEPPLKVGDYVMADRTTWSVADIRKTYGGTDQVSVWNEQDGFAIYERADLERIA